jgi:hypothetical protein
VLQQNFECLIDAYSCTSPPNGGIVMGTDHVSEDRDSDVAGGRGAGGS